MDDLLRTVGAFRRLDNMRAEDTVPFADAADVLAAEMGIKRVHAIGLINLWQLTLFVAEDVTERATQALALGPSLAKAA